MLRVCNRAGNVHDGQASVAFLGELFEQLGATLKRRPVLEMRMDGAFFPGGCNRCAGGRGRPVRDQGAILALAGAQGAHRQTPKMGARGRHGGMFRSVALGAGLVTRDACRGVPQRVRDLTAKNYQLDLFDPDDGYFEYPAIVTNKGVTGRTLWYFMCGRGTHERSTVISRAASRSIGLPTQRYHANSAWQVFSIIAFNLMRAMQAGTTKRRSTNRKRRAIRPFQDHPNLCMDASGDARTDFVVTCRQIAVCIRPMARRILPLALMESADPRLICGAELFALVWIQAWRIAVLTCWPSHLVVPCAIIQRPSAVFVRFSSARTLARPIQCAVERRVFSVGANPTQQLSLSVGSSRSGSWRQRQWAEALR